MNTEIDVSKVEVSSSQPKKNIKKKKAGLKKNRPAPLYTQEEISQISKEVFWDSIHEGRIKSIDGKKITATLLKGEHQIDVQIPNEELCAATERKEGDCIRFYLEDEIKNVDASSENPFIGSEIKAKELDLLAKAEDAFKNRETVTGYIVSEVKGGYCIALFASSRKEAEDGYGLKAFLPKALCSLSRFQEEPNEIKDIVEVKIAEIDPILGNIIVSKKELLVQDRVKLEEEFFKNHQVGDEIEGIVTSIMPYGAFLDLGCISGFLHASDVSWSKRPNIKNFLRVGEKVRTKIIELKPDEKKVKVSVKDLNSDPWLTIDEQFKPGTEVTGVIVAFADFGAFVRLQNGVEGLIHIGEICWNRIAHPSEVFKLGQVVNAAVLRVDKETRRISLSTKAIETSPVERLATQFPIGAVISTKVAAIKEFGLFVALSGDCVGLVPKNEISWMRIEQDLDKLYEVGQELEVVILGYEPKKQRATCSIKRLKSDPWQKFKKDYRKGSVHKAKVVSVVRAGVLCELGDGLTAFCPKNQLTSFSPESTRFSTKVGDEIEVYVTAIEPVTQRVTVSQKMAVESETKRAYAAYLDQQGKGSGDKTTLADAFRNLNK